MNPDYQKLVDIIKDIKFAMLSTVSEDGTIHSRPMGSLSANLDNFDGTLYFFSGKNSFKNHDIENEINVNVAYADPDTQKYASVTGKAFVTNDRALMEKLWNPILKAWFPDGLDDQNISLIGIKVESAELWDSPPGKVVQLAGFVKAAVTGQAVDHKHNSEHLDLRQ